MNFCEIAFNLGTVFRSHAFQTLRKLLGVSVVTHQNDRLGLQGTLANLLLRSGIQKQFLSAFIRR